MTYHGVCRWYWSLEMPDGNMATLPTAIAHGAERAICAHRRERKVMVAKKPHGWESKMKILNGKIFSLVYNTRHGCMATSSFLKKRTARINGKTEFVGKGTGHIILRIHLELDDENNIAGPGSYFLSSQNFPKKKIVCIATSAPMNGFDLLRENYGGPVPVCAPCNHRGHSVP